jgi:uncharacterized membrane protein YkvA (DUF1232 family)
MRATQDGVKQKPTLNQKVQQWARMLKAEVIALYFALKHPKTPLYAKIFIAIVVGYALSPIDLIPDFVPVIGYLDDVIVLPLGIFLAIRLVPGDILEACRAEARNNPPTMKPKMWIAAYVIILLWVVALVLLYYWFRQS